MRGFIVRVAVWFPIVLMFMFVATLAAHAQTFQVLHTFSCVADGADPESSMILDARGNLYGTTKDGGNYGPNCVLGCGTVFQLKHAGSGWTLNTLYTFTGGDDGHGPEGGVVFGPDGLLYGTTAGGGNGYGIVFSLAPPTHACTSALCPWTESILYRFLSTNDGQYPYAGVTFDAMGNLYGTTGYGGPHNNKGAVYELTPTQGGGWTEQVLHYFGEGQDGAQPIAGLILDATGNLYGMTPAGGTYGYGTVYELTPTQGGGWTEQVLYSFSPGLDGFAPYAGLIFDAAGDLYGTAGASDFHLGFNGAVFELTPMQGGGWMEHVLHQFLINGMDGEIPDATLVFDTAGNLYGTTEVGGTYGGGTVFELMPAQGGTWTERVLHSFNRNDTGGYQPSAGVVLDAAGNLYGTTPVGGAENCGTVYELTLGGELQDSGK
jgi:uncharacterized repeat protein (TIGR03803 family)